MNMSRGYSLRRREFLVTTAGAMAGAVNSACRAATPAEIEEAAAKVGPLPRRKLGGAGREITVLAGAATWSADAVEAGIRCGINFWHKADEWERSSVPAAILKNREAHYCQVCVDRVRGNHETGVIDEEAHVRLVKQMLQQTGLRYFDDMQFHFGYHNVNELRNNRGFVRAFERLKKEGRVRHLCLSQHSYAGNSRVPGGENNTEILSAVAQEGVYEHAQFFYSYGESGPMDAFLALARRKGFGTIAMKTTRGAGRMRQDREFMKDFPAGTTPHHALARWLTTRTALDSAIIQINSLEQFVDTYSGAGRATRAADDRALEQMAAYANREVCRLCNECASHCRRGIPIADILRYERYAQDYGEGFRARVLYAMLDRRGDACTACGDCLPHCPQELPIPEKLAAAHRRLGKASAGG
jgi:predicted aldo/keto reductase-like oxidoreductase